MIEHQLPVKTLVIRGTAEQAMLERRKALKGSSSKIPTHIHQEARMREFIAVCLIVALLRGLTPDLLLKFDT